MEKLNLLVTGASSGIGQATCRRLVASGHTVIGTARDRDRLQALGGQLGAAFHAAELDVDKPGAAGELLAGLPRAFRQIDVLINNAGHDQGGRQRFDLADAEEMCAVVETNVNGMMRVTHAVIGGMIERGRGHVVNIGSTAGKRPNATMAAYVASKHAVHGFTETLRLDYAGMGIRITEIFPGLVRTGFARRRLDDADGAAEFYDAAGRWLDPEDVADTILYAIHAPGHVEIAELLVTPAS